MINWVSLLSTGHEAVHALHTTISTDTDTDSSAIDLQDYEGPFVAFFHLGNSGDASTTIAFKVRESATSGGTYTDVPGASESLAASATANDNTVTMVHARDVSGRYAKLRVTTAGGGTPSVPVSAFILARKKIGTGSGIKTDG